VAGPTRLYRSKSEVPDKERHPGPQAWEMGIGLTFQSHMKTLAEKTIQWN
jgi:hypothetical protein